MAIVEPKTIPKEEIVKTNTVIKESVFNCLYDKDKHILRAILIDNTNNKKYSCLLAKKLNRNFFIQLEQDIEKLPENEPPLINNYLNLLQNKGITLKEDENAEIITNIGINNYIYMYKVVIIIPDIKRVIE